MWDQWNLRNSCNVTKNIKMAYSRRSSLLLQRLPQRFVLEPLLFAVYPNNLLGEVQFRSLLFADDVKLYAHRPELYLLQSPRRQFVSGHIYGPRLNPAKCSYLAIDPPQHPSFLLMLSTPKDCDVAITSHRSTAMLHTILFRPPQRPGFLAQPSTPRRCQH